MSERRMFNLVEVTRTFSRGGEKWVGLAIPLWESDLREVTSVKLSKVNKRLRGRVRKGYPMIPKIVINDDEARGLRPRGFRAAPSPKEANINR